MRDGRHRSVLGRINSGAPACRLSAGTGSGLPALRRPLRSMAGPFRKMLKLLHVSPISRTARLFKFRTPAPYGIKDERVRNFRTRGDAWQRLDAADVTALVAARFTSSSTRENVRRMLSLVKLHTLIFHPRHDDQSDIKNTMALQRKLGGMVEVSVLDDSYHLVTLIASAAMSLNGPWSSSTGCWPARPTRLPRAWWSANPLRLVRSNRGPPSRSAFGIGWLARLLHARGAKLGRSRSRLLFFSGCTSGRFAT